MACCEMGMRNFQLFNCTFSFRIIPPSGIGGSGCALRSVPMTLRELKEVLSLIIEGEVGGFKVEEIEEISAGFGSGTVLTVPAGAIVVVDDDDG